MRGYAAAVREVDAILRPLGLNLSRFEVLLLLSFTRADGMPIMRIRDLLMVHGSSVTYLVDRLGDAGLVERRADPADGRVSRVRLTDRGRATIEEAAGRLADAGFGAFAGLDDARLDALSGLLAELRRDAGGDLA